MAELTVLLLPLISVMKVRNPEKRCVDTVVSLQEKKKEGAKRENVSFK